MQLSDEPVAPLTRDRIGIYLELAATLGRRTAELHLALASPAVDPAFAPEPLTPDDLVHLRDEFRETGIRAFEGLREGLAALPDAVVESAGLVLSQRRRILDAFQSLGTRPIGGLRTRVHGDYHLGQVLLVKHDFFILDFEGEPSRPLAARRTKQSPLKDVAGMLRSLSYAVWASLLQFTNRGPEGFARLEPWARLWEQSASAVFLRAYRDTAADGSFLPTDVEDLRMLLDTSLLDKALYEVVYELNHRPAWVGIPLRAILAQER